MLGSKDRTWPGVWAGRDVEEGAGGCLNLPAKQPGQTPRMILLLATSEEVKCVVNLPRDKDEERDASEGW